jgi:hypothetical protein
MRQFFLFNLLTFGFASGLVMFLVGFAIPRRDVGGRATTAGQMYLSLCISVVLLSAALGCGMWALWASVLAVYPAELSVRDVWAPFAVSLAVMVVAFDTLMARPLLLYPGWPALRKALAQSWKGPAFQALMLLCVEGVRLGQRSVQQWLRPLWMRLQKHCEDSAAAAWDCITSIPQRRWMLRFGLFHEGNATGNGPRATV